MPDRTVSLVIDIVELAEILQRASDCLREVPFTHIFPEAFHTPLNTCLHLERQDICFAGQDIIHLGKDTKKKKSKQIIRWKLKKSKQIIRWKLKKSKEMFSPKNLKEGAWYDLMGRKYTEKPTKSGIYIKEGKKVLTK